VIAAARFCWLSKTSEDDSWTSVRVREIARATAGTMTAHRRTIHHLRRRIARMRRTARGSESVSGGTANLHHARFCSGVNPAVDSLKG
jgi:hypothetical protein